MRKLLCEMVTLGALVVTESACLRSRTDELMSSNAAAVMSDAAAAASPDLSQNVSDGHATGAPEGPDAAGTSGASQNVPDGHATDASSERPMPAAADGGMPALSCPDMQTWTSPIDCGGTPTLISPANAPTTLWAANNGVYIGSSSAVSFLPAGGSATELVWTGPGIPLAGASISGHVFVASYGPRDGYMYDLSLSSTVPLSAGFWGMGAGVATFATKDAWYWMEGVNDTASLNRADLAGHNTYLATVSHGTALAVIGISLYWLDGDVIEAPLNNPSTSSVLLAVPRSLQLWDMTTDGSRLFFIAGPIVVAVDTSGVATCLLRLTGPARLLYTAGSLFIAEPSLGHITKLDTHTNVPTCFNSSAGYVSAMAATGSTLYWIDQTAQSVKAQRLSTSE